jgi:SpoVK/Ycf46/Vps4 family AAA+-type ATPase
MLYNDIKLNYPAIWIQDNDSKRIVEMLVNTIEKEYYCIDYSKAFSQYVDNEWKTILVKNPAFDITGEDPFIPTYNSSIAFKYLEDLQKSDPKLRSMIIEIAANPSGVVQEMGELVFYLKGCHREAFWKNDLNQIPFQIIVISSQECPNEYTSLFNIQEENYPTTNELVNILQHIVESSKNKIELQESPISIAHSAIGLNESDFINLSFKSVLETGKISGEYIYNVKTSNIKKNGILEIIKPKISFDNIAGLDNIKNIIQRVKVLRDNPEYVKKYQIVPIRRMLMIGVPGCGKSAICESTANELGLDLARTGISQVMNSYVGQSEANMRKVFKQIKALNPLCVWIDEFGRDLSGGGSSSHVDGGTTDRVHGEFLTGLQELPEESFLLCAANQIENLRPEMLRADRFDKIMFVGLPSHQEREAIFRIHLSKIDTVHNYDFDLLAAKTKYMTGAEIVTLIRETKFYVTTESLRPIETNDIIDRIKHNKNIIWLKHPQMIKEMYAHALDQWDWASSLQQEEAYEIIGRKKNNTKITV